MENLVEENNTKMFTNYKCYTPSTDSRHLSYFHNARLFPVFYKEFGADDDLGGKFNVYEFACFGLKSLSGETMHPQIIIMSKEDMLAADLNEIEIPSDIDVNVLEELIEG